MRFALIRSALLTALMMAGLVGPVTEGRAQDRQPPVRIAAIEIEPEQPGPEALCQLAVRIRNDGSRPVTNFHFGVRRDGQPVKVYEDMRYLQTIPPDTTGRIKLYNFWISEPSEPPTEADQLEMEVILEEATWETIERDSNVVDHRWAGEVSALPAARTRTIAIES